MTELTEGDKVLFRVIPTLFFCFPLSHVVEVFLKHLLMFGTSFWRDIWLQGGRRESPVAGNVQFLVSGVVVVCACRTSLVRLFSYLADCRGYLLCTGSGCMS